MDLQRTIAGALAALFTGCDVTQMEAAEALGTSQARVSLLLAGHDRTRMKATELARFERLLGIEPGTTLRMSYGDNSIDVPTTIAGRSTTASMLARELLGARREVERLTEADAAASSRYSDPDRSAALAANATLIEVEQRRIDQWRAELDAILDGREVE